MAPDPGFGPINNAGGEKRLNVIFSRARQRMVLVTSIDLSAITNVYNDGANTLKNFLRYAEAVSNGDAGTATGILAGLGERRRQDREVGEVSETARQIAAALVGVGLEVQQNPGQSEFRCDLVVRRPGRPLYDVAVLVDDRVKLLDHLADERRITWPAVLESAGWIVVQALASEWHTDPQQVLDQIQAALPQD